MRDPTQRFTERVGTKDEDLSTVPTDGKLGFGGPNRRKVYHAPVVGWKSRVKGEVRTIKTVKLYSKENLRSERRGKAPQRVSETRPISQVHNPGVYLRREFLNTRTDQPFLKKTFQVFQDSSDKLQKCDLVLTIHCLPPLRVSSPGVLSEG